MAQPTTYTRQADFTDHSSNDPTSPHTGTDLDAEFNALKTTMDEVLANLALIQRDDTELANRTVGSVQLKTGVAVGVDPATGWLTATAYAVNDTVWNGGKLYVCDVAHTSGTFATDLAAANWTEIFDLAAEVPTAAGVMIGDVESKATGASPYTVVEADNGKSFLADTSAGNVTFTLPEISTLTNGDFFRILVYKTSAANTMAAARSGSDTIAGSASNDDYTVLYSAALYFSKTGDTDWKKLDLSPEGAASASLTNATNITFFKMTC